MGKWMTFLEAKLKLFADIIIKSGLYQGDALSYVDLCQIIA